MFKFSVQEGRFSFRVLVLCWSRFHSGTHRGPVNLDVISPKQSLVLSNAKSNFSLFHIVWFVTATCLVLVIFRFSHSLAIVCCPLAIAPPISHAVKATRSTIVSGVIAAILWTLFCLTISLMVAFQFGVLYDSGELVASGALVVAFVSSSIGGCVGGKFSVN